MAQTLDGEGLVAVERTVHFQVKVVATVIFLLSRSLSLAQGYFVSVRGRANRLIAGDVDHVTNAQLVRWWNEEQIAVAVCRALLSLSDGCRILADKFLMSSMLAEFVLKKDLLGIAVSLSSLVAISETLEFQKPGSQSGCIAHEVDALCKCT